MSESFYGIHKLTEEAGELIQVLGKLGEFPDGSHPDGNGSLIVRLNEELTDLEAAIQYFRETNDLALDRNRFLTKMKKFRQWGLKGISSRR